ncbi:hypothetical protein DH2020_007196 [Rehmannia glutinosa]|uniref:Retrotransposon Copia-like N-terminal domain-containing protein n=1 Tax=Rehmannia glutinosa TaxID=99300 RepID=A0ABR0TY50_REHGL
MDLSPSMHAGLCLLLQNFNSLVHLKLDNTNYNLWRAQIHSVLDAHDLLSHVTEETSCPPILSKDAEGVPVLPHVISLATTPKIWTALEQRFLSLYRTHIYQLKMQLLTLNKGTKYMQKYLDGIKTLTVSLAAVNESIKDEDLMLYILRGLSPEFEAFKATFRLNMNRSLSLHDFAALLIAEELNLNLQKPGESGSVSKAPTILFTPHRGRGAYKGRGSGRYGNRGGSTSGIGNFNIGG